MTPTTTEIRDSFHRHDLRCTRQRELVFGALAASTAHPTAEELYLAVRAQDPGLSLATVYNTLEAIVSCGMGRKISTAGSGPCRYDADISPHVHLATGDGRVVDVPDDLSARLLAGLCPKVVHELEQRLGVSVSWLNLQVVVQGPERVR